MHAIPFFSYKQTIYIEYESFKNSGHQLITEWFGYLWHNFIPTLFLLWNVILTLVLFFRRKEK